jgi:hypothetical protein
MPWHASTGVCNAAANNFNSVVSLEVCMLACQLRMFALSGSHDWLAAEQESSKPVAEGGPKVPAGAV